MHSAHSFIEILKCPRCYLTHDSWIGVGYISYGTTYCCRSCAEGWGCLCLRSAFPAPHYEEVVYTGPERRIAPPQRAWKQERRRMFLRSR